MNVRKPINSSLLAMAVVAAAQLPAPASAAPYNIPNVPLIVSIDTIPNIWFMMDDSGSMDSEVLAGDHFTSCSYNSLLQCNDPERREGGLAVWSGRWNNGTDKPVLSNTINIYDFADSVYRNNCYHPNDNSIGQCIEENGYSRNRTQGGQTARVNIQRDWRIRSHHLNKQFFNPGSDYVPWSSFDDRFANASFDAARSWPVPGEGGYTNQVNLNSPDEDQRSFFYHYWIDDKHFSGSRPRANGITPNMTNVAGQGSIDEWDSYIRVSFEDGAVVCEKVSHDPKAFSWPDSIAGLNPSVSAASTAECALATGGQTAADLKQNIANWFQYYRKRTHVARGAVGNVAVRLPEFRYGIGHINKLGDRHEIPATQITDYQANTTSMLNMLYGSNRAGAGTPLRRGLEWVGKMYGGDQGSIPSPITEYCQKNFALLFSDGYWNGGDPATPNWDVDEDGQSINANGTMRNVTLADVAAHYYRNDLRTDLQDGVPTDNFDSANWQHMVTYTIAFGVKGALEAGADGWPNPKQTDSSDWYSGDTLTDRVDDLWHAAWNSRGQYFNANDPEDLYNDVRDALNNIASRIGGAASAAANSGSISSTSRIFQAKFDTSDWHGELLAFPVNDDGTLGATAVWNSNTLLNTKGNTDLGANGAGRRDVFTWNKTGTIPTGTAFAWGNLTGDQRDALNVAPDGTTDSLGPDRLLYIRGVSSDEVSNGGQFRNRINKLGDIVNSDPTFVGFPPFFYPFGDYQSFFASNVNRTGVIYFGANDGMFHAVRESDGEIMFSYVPDKIIPKLTKLTDPDYQHEFYVDGPPSYGDVQLSNGDWKSVVASGLRSGGQGLFALDVTNPDTFSASNVLWEFTDANDADLGYTYSEPQIKLMANGKWAVIIGSGLNNTEADGHVSTTGTGALFILFIEDGRNGWDTNDWVKITVPGGSVGNPNALFTPAAADLDGDSKVDVIYAGDRFGKVWKFDVSSASPGSWAKASGDNPFFDAGVGHPVTDRPAVAAHPLGRSLGQLVTFGTGSYLEVADNTSVGQPTQSIYAVWDFSDSFATAKSISSANRYGHSRAEMSGSSMGVSSGVRVMSGGADVDWLDENGDPEDYGWYVDLPTEGERMVRRPVLRDNLVFFVSMIPDDDPCSAGGTGWIMVMDAATGQAPRFPVFDINNDRDVNNENDRLPSTVEGIPGLVPVGVSSPSIPNLPALIYDDRPGFSASTAPFPPIPNAVRGCDAGSARAYTFTTGSNGAILAIETATETLSCGRQAWRGER